MSENNLLNWISDFLSQYSKVEQSLIEHIIDCDGSIDQQQIEEALDEFKNNH